MAPNNQAVIGTLKSEVAVSRGHLSHEKLSAERNLSQSWAQSGFLVERDGMELLCGGSSDSLPWKGPADFMVLQMR